MAYLGFLFHGGGWGGGFQISFRKVVFVKGV